VLEGEAQNHRQFVHIGRLEARQPVLRHADQRRHDRLVRAALARQADAGRGGDQNEPRVLITGIVQRIQPTLDERIV
jgi:hypothetical protein